MLRVYEVVIESVRRGAPVIEKINQHDPDRARQIAAAFGYIAPLDGESVAMVRQIIGTLVRCMR